MKVVGANFAFTKCTWFDAFFKIK